MLGGGWGQGLALSLVGVFLGTQIEGVGAKVSKDVGRGGLKKKGRGGGTLTGSEGHRPE